MSTANLRLFIAVEIDEAIRQRICAFVETVRASIGNVRWSRPEDLHVTLKFLGHVATAKREAIEGALRKVRAPQFEMSVGEIGVFPNPKSARVLWVGVSAGPELGRLAATIDESMSGLAFEREHRTFTPHVTLARMSQEKRRWTLEDVVGVKNTAFGTMTAAEFHLYESKLSPQGSRYSKLASFPLK